MPSSSCIFGIGGVHRRVTFQNLEREHGGTHDILTPHFWSRRLPLENAFRVPRFYEVKFYQRIERQIKIEHFEGCLYIQFGLNR